jgi:secondary thiamine-phosphate synthase enzyme
VQPFTNSYRPAEGTPVPRSANGSMPQRDGSAQGSRIPGSTAATTPGTIARVDSIVELGHLSPVVARRSIHLVTERAFHVTDVTDDCLALLDDSGVREGLLSVYSEHTTCALRINERETCFLEDLRLFMEKLVPAGAYYRHDDFEIRDPQTLAGEPEDEPINGHAHIKQMLLGCASESIPVVGGRLGLGRWQRVMFIELDQSRPRTINLQVQGWR